MPRHSKSAIEAIRNGETNISCDIITVLEQLHSKRKSCILQWITAHVNIEGNECADSLAKEARDIEHKCTTITLDDANAGYVKSLVYADKPQTLDHLEDNIRRVIADIRPQMLEKVIENWTSRLDYIRASRGSPMPEII
ncbi:hypothetical protein TNCV_4586231 [Trichonephila clavipes]|nr:hypothetical protein TNCV_4586231 [Trichonephila clavipes]